MKEFKINDKVQLVSTNINELLKIYANVKWNGSSTANLLKYLIGKSKTGFVITECKYLSFSKLTYKVSLSLRNDYYFPAELFQIKRNIIEIE